ncbi:AraC family transcriptional regulator [Deltaproteobacteria bacterium OttesenSCG-928-M10]|nr:AraC family transcriptional regulator [Deltaproteobacteria bacterium OttesenSCG-928-M10]
MARNTEDIKAIMAQHSEKIRAILRRNGLGLIVDVVQKCDLYVASIAIDEPALVVVKQGMLTLQVGGREWIANTGEAIAIAAGQTVNIVNHLSDQGIYEEKWLTWDLDIVKEFAASGKQGTPSLTEAKVLGPIEPSFVESFDSAFASIEANESLPMSIGRHRMSEVLIWLSLQGIYFDTKDKNTLSARIRRLLNTALDEDWSEESVAEKTGQSPATLRRHLAAEGTTFREVLINARMLYALRLLQSSDMPISQIALEVGYESQSRFAVRFRKRFGFQPSVVRGHKRRGGN